MMLSLVINVNFLRHLLSIADNNNCTRGIDEAELGTTKIMNDCHFPYKQSDSINMHYIGYKSTCTKI